MKSTIVFLQVMIVFLQISNCISSNQGKREGPPAVQQSPLLCTCICNAVTSTIMPTIVFLENNYCIPWKQQMYSLKTTIVFLENKDTGRELSNICHYFASAMLSFLQCQQFHSLKWRTMIKRIVCIDVVFGNWLKQSQGWNFETGVDFKVHSLLHGSNPITSMQTFLRNLVMCSKQKVLDKLTLLWQQLQCNHSSGNLSN